MLPELQGRLPIRVELQGLTEDDFYRILTEPEANLVRQQQALMETEVRNYVRIYTEQTLNKCLHDRVVEWECDRVVEWWWSDNQHSVVLLLW